jgi:flavodoxin
MKRIALMLMALLLGLGVYPKEPKKPQTNVEGLKVLVVYFSASGVTRGVAERLAAVTGANLYEIKPMKPYTAADLDWRNKQSRSSLEMTDQNSRPAIAKTLADLQGYDVVYVGFPIWWNTRPAIINTFMESYDFKGKTVIPFATSGSSSIIKACEDLKKAYPLVNWKAGRLLNNASKEEMKEWVDESKRTVKNTEE